MLSNSFADKTVIHHKRFTCWQN